MIIQRSVGLAIVLSIITCGIYGIYWFIVMTNDVGKLSGDSSFTGGKHFLLTLVTCGIWSFVWAYQVGKQIAEAQRQRGLTITDNSTLYIIFNLFGLSIVTYALVQSDINKLGNVRIHA
ncbi:DUF4234 domain-containing protein [Cohnella cholangitidis]|uniref:DUF4234 domain-containing protein n=1 Tax=Cohnella cholangitidis TaxID=2598458 RepID=A0A7G5BYI7_9BACL|nr:DUF4234 domain-containing protein [Cohnella cholangitidis]QMV42021.1 DUF4234 domain-containing protein [Cohnella cholangitidis]